MKRVGVVVEGPSDFVFWKRLLNRTFARYDYWFDVRSLKGGSRVIQEAPKLTDDFHKAGYHSAIFIIDADKVTCPSEVLVLFEEQFLRQVREPKPTARFTHIFVAFRELESWILADEVCVRLLLDFPEYAAPAEALPAGKAKLLRLCREHGDFSLGMQDLEFARQAAGLFDPLRAKEKSSSFAFFWDRLIGRLHVPWS